MRPRYLTQYVVSGFSRTRTKPGRASCSCRGMRTGTPGHLKAFHYMGLQRYFLTFCTNNRERVFISKAPFDPD